MARNETVGTEKHVLASRGKESGTRESWPPESAASDLSGNGVPWLDLAGERARIRHCADLLEDMLNELHRAETDRTHTQDPFYGKIKGIGHG